MNIYNILNYKYKIHINNFRYQIFSNSKHILVFQLKKATQYQ
ncbi:hypothetical protein pb186bvf_003316 [Paramecium bursaria]